MRAPACLVAVTLAACGPDVITPLLVSDGEIDPPRDRGPRLDESVPDSASSPADDLGVDATPGDGGCDPTDADAEGVHPIGDGAPGDAGCGAGAA